MRISDSLSYWTKTRSLQIDSICNYEISYSSSADRISCCIQSQKSLSFTSCRLGITSSHISMELFASTEFLWPPLTIELINDRIR